MQWPSAWRCSDAGVISRPRRSTAHAAPRRGGYPGCLPRRGVRRREAGGGRARVGAARPRVTRGARTHPPGRPGPAPDSDRECRERRATRHVAVRDRRPAEAGQRAAGPATHHESPPRAPMTARVSFADRAKRTGAAVAWIVAFGVVGGASGWALSRLGPEPSPAWSLAWSSLSGAVGFGLATWLVRGVLDRRPWAYLGWRPGQAGPARRAGGGALWAVVA